MKRLPVTLFLGCLALGCGGMLPSATPPQTGGAPSVTSPETPPGTQADPPVPRAPDARPVVSTQRRPFHAHVVGTKFSPDGQLVFVSFAYQGDGRDDPRVRPLKLFEVPSGREVGAFTGYSLPALDFLPDSKRVLAVSPGGWLRIWEARTGDLVRRVGYSRDAVHEVEVSPNGSRALWSARNGILQLWDLVDDKRIYAKQLFPSLSVLPETSHFVFRPDDGALAFFGYNAAISPDKKRTFRVMV